MNAYLCDANGIGTILVAAESRGQARATAAWELDTDFMADMSIRLLETDIGDCPRGWIADGYALGRRLWRTAAERGLPESAEWRIDWLHFLAHLGLITQERAELCEDLGLSVADALTDYVPEAVEGLP